MTNSPNWTISSTTSTKEDFNNIDDLETADGYVKDSNSVNEVYFDHLRIPIPLTLEGRNGKKWLAMPHLRVGQNAPCNFILNAPITWGQVGSAKIPLEIWSYLFDDSMIEQINQFTQSEVNRRLVKIPKKQSYHRKISITEICALVGLLNLADAMKSCNNTDDLWPNPYGESIFRATMSQARFKSRQLCCHS